MNDGILVQEVGETHRDVVDAAQRRAQEQGSRLFVRGEVVGVKGVLFHVEKVNHWRLVLVPLTPAEVRAYIEKERANGTDEA